ncbi:unnamed protein product [Sphagnum jensenii]|uniref:Nodulin-like domain-containing protein n=1 Tax=Sphagnum jensenii TaxID=128206 RepID=A0ABP0VR62_9BRYO
MGSGGGYGRISKKWVGFVTAIWVQSIAGNNYTFANYSGALKTVMQYDQTQLNNLGVAKDVGKSFGLVAGFLADYMPTWAILLIGALEGLVGYGVQYLVVSQRVARLPFWQMGLALGLGGNSTTWMNTAVLVTCMRNFPHSRGTVTGMLKGYIGLSTAIFTQLCTALFTSEASAFLLLLTFLPAIICFVAIAFLGEVSPSCSHEEDAEEQSNFTILNTISMGLAFYLLTFTLIANFFPISPFGNKLFAQVLLLFLLAPLAVPFKLFFNKFTKDHSPARLKVDETTTPLLLGGKDHGQQGGEPNQQQFLDNMENGHEESLVGTEEQCLVMDDVPILTHQHLDDPTSLDNQQQPERARKTGVPALGEDHTLLDALQTIDFWLLFFSFLCGVGTGITAINNLGQIGEAQGYSDVSLFISLISIWGFFGRIGAGAISEYYVRKAAVPRPVWMALSQVFLLVGYILFAVAAPGSLYIGSIVVGICYGVHISITVPTASELFGLKHFGIVYNFLILNLPLGSFLFSGLLAGWLYDREAAKSPQVGYEHLGMVQLMASKELNSSSSMGWASSSDPQTCTGAHCFFSVFMVMAGMCAVGFVLNIILMLRIRPLYQSLYGPNGTAQRKKSPQLTRM